MSGSREGSLAPAHVPARRSRGESLTESPVQETPGVGGSSRRLRRFRGFGQRLKFVKELVQSTGTPGPDYAYKPARISSTLTMWGVPEGLGGTPSPLGLSPRRNSQEQMRRGLKGMPPCGSKKVKELLHVLEEFRSRLVFWHVTLPDEDYFDLRDLGTWAIFQRRLFDRLTQYLSSHGDPALMVGVCEIGEVRMERTKRPMPHLHIISTGYRSKIDGKAYLLSPAVMDELVQKACEDAGLPPRDRQASSRMEAIRYSVRGYVDKYLTKGSGLPGKCLSDGWDALIPHQWWNRSDGLHKMLQGLIFHLPPSFVAFVLQQRQRLEGLRLGFARVVQVGSRKTLCGEVPIKVDSFRFWQPEHLLMTIELWHWWIADPKAWDEGGEACLHLDELASHNGETALPRIPLNVG